MRAGVSSRRRAFAQLSPSNVWRTFEVTTRVEVLEPAGVTRVWLPAALISPAPYQRTLANTLTATEGTTKIVEAIPDALGIVVADFAAGARPVLTLTSRVATRDHAIDLSAPDPAAMTASPSLEWFLRPTKLLPTNGIVREAASDITRGARTDLDKARAIYDWIVDNTFVAAVLVVVGQVDGCHTALA